MGEQSELKANQAYEIFKLQWMINHRFTLSDIIQCLQEMKVEAEGKHMWEPMDSRGNCLECIKCGDYISYYGDPDENGLRKWDKVINGPCTGDDELPLLLRRWEHRVGFAGGQIWPCFEEYLQNEYQE